MAHPYADKSAEHRSGKMDRMTSGYKSGGGVRPKSGKTTVNIVVGAGGQQPPAPAMPIGGPPPGAAAAPPMPPRPPMAPPMMPPGGPPMMPPGGGMPMRKAGGRIKDGPAWAEGIRSGTKVSHTPGRNDIDHLATKPPITAKTGGRIAPKMTAGSESGPGRLQKTRMQKRVYP